MLLLHCRQAAMCKYIYKVLSHTPTDDLNYLVTKLVACYIYYDISAASGPHPFKGLFLRYVRSYTELEPGSTHNLTPMRVAMNYGVLIKGLAETEENE